MGPAIPPASLLKVLSGHRRTFKRLTWITPLYREREKDGNLARQESLVDMVVGMVGRSQLSGMCIRSRAGFDALNVLYMYSIAEY